MVLEAQTKNRQAETQISELMGLQQDVNKLQSNENSMMLSSNYMNNYDQRQGGYGSVNQLFEASQVPITSSNQTTTTQGQQEYEQPEAAEICIQNDEQQQYYQDEDFY